MAGIEAFRSRVATNVLNCPDMVIDQAVLDASIEFCERSNIIRATLAQINLVANDFLITLAAPASCRLVQVQSAWVDGTEIAPLPADNAGVFEYVTAVTGQSAKTGAPRFFSEASPGVIALHPRPDKAYVLTVRASTKPSRAAIVVDDALLEDWANAVSCGALSILYSMRAEWADQALAKSERKRFDSFIGDALIEASRGRNRAEAAVRPVWI